MDIDPHTLQQILDRIKQQMRCPQCGRHVPVDFRGVKVVSDTSLLMQLKCEGCNAFIVMNASLQGVEHLSAKGYEEQDATANASSTLQMSDSELETLSAALKESGGSFEKMFKKHEPNSPSSAKASEDM